MLDAVERDLRALPEFRSIRAAIYFYATLADPFGPCLDNTPESVHSDVQALATQASQLADARVALADHPGIAWEIITRFRAAGGMRSASADRPADGTTSAG